MINSPIDEIKNRLNIVEVIGGYIKLQKAGQNFRALCPFHSEKTPSFFVSPTRQIWHCFGGCSEGGDIFKFIMKIEGVEFGDALRLLAQKAGVELKKQDPKIRSERERLYEICELTTKFFKKQLEESKIGKEAKQYLLGRKINEESLEKWRLGYAPDVWQGLSDFLNSQGYSQEEIKKAGLGLSSKRGSFEQVSAKQKRSVKMKTQFSSTYDRFRGRIIFPIFDLNSKVIGFTGRVFKGKNEIETSRNASHSFQRCASANAEACVAKYVNTPQSLLYDKSRVLYGLDRAKVAIRRKGVCILVEGNTDLIMLHQHGFENAVAVSGTALTSYQLNILKRYSDNLLIAFDMDAAGQTAVKKGIDLAQEQGFNIKVIELLGEKDPAEIIAKDVKKWEKALAGAKTILDFYFDSAFSGKDLKAPEIKKEIAKILLPVIKKIPNKIEQAHWIQELAKRLAIKEEYIEEELKKASISASVSEAAGQKSAVVEASKSRREMIEERIIILILESPQQIELIDKKLISSFSDLTQAALNSFRKGKFNVSSKKPELNNFLNRLSLKAEIEEEMIEEKDIGLEFQSCLREIQKLNIKEKLDKISKEIKEAEEKKDLKKIEKLTQEFNLCSKSLFDLEVRPVV